MPFAFDPHEFPVAVQQLWTDRLCELGPGTPNREAAARLESTPLSQLFADQEITDRQMAQCCLSGLWLLHNYLDESHTISQSVPSSSGSYWHGIMHRREPDYSNAKYWFRRVGDHPIYADLCVAAADLASESADQQTEFLATQSTWDPFRFVDACQRVDGTKSDAERLCREVAQVEWQILFSHCYRAAV